MAVGSPFIADSQTAEVIVKFALMKGHASAMKCVEKAVSLDVGTQAKGVNAGSCWILTSAKPERTAAR
jgi:hypothetical protein